MSCAAERMAPWHGDMPLIFENMTHIFLDIYTRICYSNHQCNSTIGAREEGHVQSLPAGTAATEKEHYGTRTLESIREYYGGA